MALSDRELSLALEHPRGIERRTLLPYQAVLTDVAAYARLPVTDRDVIVRWVEIRRRLLEEHGLDRDDANFADPLLPYAGLRAHVLAGERAARGVVGDDDLGGDLRELVAAIRRS